MSSRRGDGKRRRAERPGTSMRRRVGGRHTSPFWGAWVCMIERAGRGEMDERFE